MRTWLAAGVRTELLALATVRAPWLLAAAAVSTAGWLSASAVLTAGRGPAPSVGTAGAALAVVSAPGRAAAAAVVLGVLAVTGEFRHATIGGRLLAAPSRGRLLTAQAVAAAVVAAAIGLVAVVVALAVGARTLSPDVINADLVARGAGLVAAYPAYAALGVGIGALLSDLQALAVALPVAWLLGLESVVVVAIAPAAGPWALTGATAALGHDGDLAPLLPAWAGGCLLVAYAAIALVAGAARLVRRDIA